MAEESGCFGFGDALVCLHRGTDVILHGGSVRGRQDIARSDGVPRFRLSGHCGFGSAGSGHDRVPSSISIDLK